MFQWQGDDRDKYSAHLRSFEKRPPRQVNDTSWTCDDLLKEASSGRVMNL